MENAFGKTEKAERKQERIDRTRRFYLQWKYDSLHKSRFKLTKFSPGRYHQKKKHRFIKIADY